MHTPIVQFIIIGSMKSGTTTLSDYLSSNDEISMCKYKEPQFFSSYYDKGVAYYESLWTDRKKVCGEASTCYSRWPFYDAIPEKIASYNPRMKLIYILRHPVDRAYSHYSHNVLTDNIAFSSFNDAITSSDEILLTSMYMKQLERFLEFFPKEQLLLVDFDQLKNEPYIVINQVEQFIGVKCTEQNYLKQQVLRSNQAGVTSSRRDVGRIIYKVREFPIISLLVEKLFSQKRRHLIGRKIKYYISNSKLINKYALAKSNRLQPLKGKDRDDFLLKLLSDVTRLEKFWNRDLSKWKV